ncbi:hypothetical protein BKN38_01600 [Helicobacter sp. CLO-3]|uniref:peptidyl-prolyl cis-trans isomerase n=1 Tax=unclassified Helicobacter TaxID=2593540 RepID=UPI000805AFCD|nr:MULTISPECIES: peptidyl-prolyl cis-trans isomerase [unclassified Helicobacter]OBV29796.1 hypothetical protein BA723_00400 [Helicobacter sp. CLO-3]OHU85250.1 hypothetical protein BKN38_01600 [Helicobacter sp. CLO-3]
MQKEYAKNPAKKATLSRICGIALIGMLGISALDSATPESKTTPESSSAQNSAPSATNAPSAANSANKNIIGGIAIKVNGDPITIYEIKNLMIKQHISKDQAQEFLIAQRLKNQEIKRLKIDVDDIRLDQEIQAIASQNKLTYQQFINALRQEGMTLDVYKEQLKDQIQTRELMRNILLSSDVSSENEMRRYYDTHKSEFVVAKEVQTTRYSAKDPKLLERAIKSPLVSINGVEKVPEKLTLSALNPQIAQMFSTLKAGEFSPVLDAGNGSYVAFLVQDKIGEDAMSFEEAKNYIAQKLAQSNQEQVLGEYFEKIKLKARIEYLRAP